MFSAVPAIRTLLFCALAVRPSAAGLGYIGQDDGGNMQLDNTGGMISMLGTDILLNGASLPNTLQQLSTAIGSLGGASPSNPSITALNQSLLAATQSLSAAVGGVAFSTQIIAAQASAALGAVALSTQIIAAQTSLALTASSSLSASLSGAVAASNTATAALSTAILSLAASQSVALASLAASHSASISNLGAQVATLAAQLSAATAPPPPLPGNYIYTFGGTSFGSAVLPGVERFHLASGVSSLVNVVIPTYGGSAYSYLTGAAAAAIGNVIFFFGGENTAAARISFILRFDPVTNTFSVATPILSAARGYAAAVVANSFKVFVVGGRGSTGTPLATVEQCNFLNTTLVSCGSSASMNVVRVMPAVALYNNTVFVFGGDTGSGATATVEAISASNPVLWVGQPSMITARIGPTAAAAGSYIYIAGGMLSGTVLSSVERFDPRFGQWTTMASLAHPCALASMILPPTGGALYVMGGSAVSGGTPISTVQYYNISTNSWSLAGYTQYARYGSVALLVVF